MRFEPTDPARSFRAGRTGSVTIQDCGSIRLAADEQVTFTTPSGAEYDVARKDWGFYATPSLNGRLAGFGLRGVLVRNTIGRYFVLLVERGLEAAFDEYVAAEQLSIVIWLDSTDALKRLERALPR